MNPTNKYRAERCEKALRRCGTAFDLTDCLVDFLVDARHWCHQHGHDYAKFHGIADEYYTHETSAACGRDQ